MLKNKIRVLTHKLLLPRGRQYRHQADLETGWNKHFIVSGEKKICMIHKSISDGNKGVVILSHPYVADAKCFFLTRGHAQMYLDKGFDVVLFDFNGFGESSFVDFDYCSDLKVVVEYMHQHKPGFPIFGHGISFGASHTITYSTQTDNCFKKIIIENCLDSNLSYYKNRNRKLHFTMLGLMKIFPTVNKDHNYVNSVGRLKKVDRVLFIYNIEDDLTTVQMGEQLMNACNIPSGMEIFHGQHLQAFQKNEEKYTKDVISFLLDL